MTAETRARAVPDVVERLRSLLRPWGSLEALPDLPHYHAQRLAGEAAAEIERLRAERDKLAEISQQQHEAMMAAMPDMRRMVDEVERLRAALRSVAEHADMRAELYTNAEDAAAALGDIARAALERAP